MIELPIVIALASIAAKYFCRRFDFLFCQSNNLFFLRSCLKMISAFGGQATAKGWFAFVGRLTNDWHVFEFKSNHQPPVLLYNLNPNL